MIVSTSNLRRRGTLGGQLLRHLFVLFLLVSAGWCFCVYRQIDSVANQDDAQPADSIAVFGAAVSYQLAHSSIAAPLRG